MSTTKEVSELSEKMLLKIGELADQEVSPILKYTKITPHAYTPEKGSRLAAGYDLKSNHDTIIPAKGKTLISTGLKFELPKNCYGRIAPRSGLAVNHFIDVGAGVIDEDYRGEIKILLFNHSDEDFHVRTGDMIAQIICERIFYPELQEVNNMSSTERGEKGFGSTEKNM
ncbi:deoxyuridine 5'-triphosphate nucleotidohydrolase-like [Anthonomus grandis grandis]|uniref:deoxyuridine 5'-triphosphate nucleotidohydrolase-like n=1 Tax=Anthonomus grandis grandis TaxID=2921223 RepID=UPI00216523CA|nr:deoxyuridine 5'-triphosphate nucleotidohydrolase-like [Anthonomus grandis grandis]XP_050295069.1 deoxyuridine 5'-triphosphate nucleotidohydrolase-like [Anthonomus grandis grandis]XP_050295537.1 deoxyuridine 5'-triphosphate nucleotidohydrolase-like [Anthonomus grandis grandis]XP_050305691.1 deoxyuridine 5'-triphosphate nucleotidohydrolase-like [Anthonomus grandis grandis]XP_050308637.1 deoxyuridine 5'-triphosphate nucleotidohydrolase-like [Anthonomus grandis grandis]